jgi:hypothetical protein
LTIAAPPIPDWHADDAVFAAIIPDSKLPLGEGTTRKVYALPGHTDKVLKVAKDGSNAANWVEAVVYWSLTDKTGFGEVLAISRSGKYLVMERLDDLAPNGAAGQQVPNWWTDRKSKNFGRSPVSGAVKIRDYALVNLNLGVLTPMPSAEDNAEMRKWMGLFS